MAIARKDRLGSWELWGEFDRYWDAEMARINGQLADLEALRADRKRLVDEADRRHIRIKRLLRPGASRALVARLDNAAKITALSREIREAVDAANAHATALLAEAEQSAVHENTRAYRNLGLGFAVAWLVQAVLIASGHTGSRDGISLDFYLACSPIYPVLVIAGLVELGAVSGRILRAGMSWRVLTFMIPAIAGEMACLRTLAVHRSTSITFTDAWLSLAVTTVVLLYFVLILRSTGADKRESVLRAHAQVRSIASAGE